MQHRKRKNGQSEYLLWSWKMMDGMKRNKFRRESGILCCVSAEEKVDQRDILKNNENKTRECFWGERGVKWKVKANTNKRRQYLKVDSQTLVEQHWLPRTSSSLATLIMILWVISANCKKMADRLDYWNLTVMYNCNFFFCFSSSSGCPLQTFVHFFSWFLLSVSASSRATPFILRIQTAQKKSTRQKQHTEKKENKRNKNTSRLVMPVQVAAGQTIIISRARSRNHMRHKATQK